MLGGEFVTRGPGEGPPSLSPRVSRGADRLGCAEGISFTDEWYAQPEFAKDLHVILVQETALMKGGCYRRPDYPNAWGPAARPGPGILHRAGPSRGRVDESILPGAGARGLRLGAGECAGRGRAQYRPGDAARQSIEKLKGAYERKSHEPEAVCADGRGSGCRRNPGGGCARAEPPAHRWRLPTRPGRAAITRTWNIGGWAGPG